MLFLLAMGCGEAEPSLVIGHGVAGGFIPYEDGQEAGILSAPQGGFGVPVRAQTTGLYCGDEETPNAPVAVLLETWIDGEVSASFLNDTAVIYCQEDGTGLVWDLVVGFSKDDYGSSNLVDLDGVTVDLVVEATDEDGVTVGSEVTIQILVQ